MDEGIENLLRKPYEIYSGATYSIASLSLLTPFGAYVVNNPSWLLPLTSTLACWGSYRLYQSSKLIRYQKSLRRMPKFEMSSSQIPWSRDRLYLGIGFRWDQRHTERLEQLKQAKHRHLTLPSKLYRMAREIEHRHYRNAVLEGVRNHIALLTKQDTWWNPVAPLPPIGGNSAIHSVGLWEGEAPCWEAISERVGHKVVVGTTRVGKTRLAEIMITQDIRRGNVVIVFDPKSDADLLRRMYLEAKKAGREDDFIIFHLGFPELSWGYNPIGDFEKVTEVADRIAGQLPGEGNSRAFRDFVWRFVNVITRALVALSIKPDFKKLYRYAQDVDGLLVDLYELFFDKVLPDWRNRLALMDIDPSKVADKALKQRDPLAVTYIEFAKQMNLISDANQEDTSRSSLELADIARSLSAILNNERSYFDKLVSSLYPLLEKLTTGQVGDVISPNLDDPYNQTPIFDWMEAFNRKAIVYVGLDSLSIPMVAATVGSSMFADITSKAGRMYKHGVGYGFVNPRGEKISISIHADEFNELIGDEFIPLLNKAGGAGFEVTVYTQTWADVEAKIGSKAKADQISGNLNTLIMLRVKNKVTAQLLTDQVDEVLISTVTPSSGVSDNNDTLSDFKSSNQDIVRQERVACVTPSDITKLPKGQAFALLEGGQLWKLRFPMPVKDPADGILPDSLSQMVRQMRSKYESYAEQWSDQMTVFRENEARKWNDNGL